jgi:N-acetylated-alpha-linked acidic dipeptidase
LYGLGTPAAEMGFYGPFGVYHSSYDTVRYATLFSDPTFALHRATAQLYGVLAMRLASADVVPYHFTAYVPLMRSTLTSIAALARTSKIAIDTRALQTSVDRFAAAAAAYDAATANATTGAGDRALEAARTLDLVAYSANGYASETFPELARAVPGGSGAFDAAATRVRAAIDRATGLLAP